MTYTLKEAADAVGMGKPAILKAIQRGKISAEKDEQGQWRIEPAELHRVYQPVSGNSARTMSEETQETIGNGNGNRILEKEIEFLREKLAGLEQMREQERRLLSGQIEDLRRDREDLRGERDRLLKVIEEQASSVKLLTDQRVAARELPEAPQKAAEGHSWFAGWFARRRS